MDAELLREKLVRIAHAETAMEARVIACSMLRKMNRARRTVNTTHSPGQVAQELATDAYFQDECGHAVYETYSPKATK
jgi:hypothetical protein